MLMVVCQIFNFRRRDVALMFLILVMWVYSVRSPQSVTVPGAIVNHEHFVLLCTYDCHIRFHRRQQISGVPKPSVQIV